MHGFLTTARKGITGLLLVSIMVSSGAFALVPQPAHAQVNSIVHDPLNFIENKFSAVMASLSTATLKTLGLKEWTLDGVLFALAKKALQQMVRSTVSWINSGFKGSPMYITDPTQFLTNVGDEVAGEIIYNSNLKFLCSPLNMRIALEFYYRASQRRQAPQCTLSGVARNVDQFVKGNFLAGGWPGWLAVSITPTNQPIGGVLALVETLDSSVGKAQEAQVMRLNWGSGFLSFEDCSSGKCQIVTPGKTIADALSFSVTVGERTLIEADEINEIIGALFAQLGNQALTSLRGVNGLSRPAPFGSSGGISPSVPTGCAALSYLDQLNDPRCNPNTGGVTGTSTTPGTASFVDESLAAERSYQDLYEGVRDTAQDVMDEAADEGLGCRANERANEDAREIHNDASEKIAESDTLIAKLLDIKNRYSFGSGEAQVAAINEYIALEGSGTLHSDIDSALEQRTVDNLKASLETIRDRIDTCRRDDDDDETS